MVARRFAGILSVARLLTLFAVCRQAWPASAPTREPPAWSTGAPGRGASREEGDPINLPEAEQMIDELDRIMTATGRSASSRPTSGGRTGWRNSAPSTRPRWPAGSRPGSRADINAVGPTERVRGHAGPGRRRLVEHLRQAGYRRAETPSDRGVTSRTFAGARGWPSLARARSRREGCRAARAHRRARRALELPESPQPVAADQRGRRPDRPAGLWSLPGADPGHALARAEKPAGQGSDHHVSAKSLMTKDTLRNTLRNAVINETVNNLTQAICNQAMQVERPYLGPGRGPFSLVSFADAEVFYGARNIACCRARPSVSSQVTSATSPITAAPAIAEWLRGELEASYHLLEQAATPASSTAQIASPGRPARGARRPDRHRRDFARLAAAAAGQHREIPRS